ncbi:PhnE/PtxC family ABC transporter permease [Sinomonas sp. P47F7]|uniref:PhnE/PtxC family ABC transporter permease n=1 Tax=Sinomonas sp. P47F7 TaxID=3410987 RepID=UPI003BF55160
MTATAAEPTSSRAGARDIEGRAPRRPFPLERTAAVVLLIAMLVFGVWSVSTLDFSWNNMATSFANATKVFSHMDPVSLPGPGDLFTLIGITFGIVVLGTLVASLLSIPVAVLAAANTTPAPWLRPVGRALGVVARAVPDVVLALAFSLTFALGSPLPGIFALGIHSIGMISKLFADAIEQSDDGPRLAIRAAGGSRAQEFWAGVFPQVLPSWIATALHRFDINLRGSAILGYAGVGGLGYAMKVAFAQFPEGYGRGLGIGCVIFMMCVVLEVASSTIRRNLLGVAPTGRGLGDRIVRAATKNRTAHRAAEQDAAARTAPRAAGPRGDAEVLAMLRRPWTPERVRDTSWAVIGIAVIVVAWFVSDIDFTQVEWQFVPRVIESFWPPSLGSYTFDDFGQALLVTIEVAFASALLSLVFSLVFGSLAARNVAPTGAVRNTFRVILVIFRGVPELVLAIFLIMVTGLGNQAGVVALAFGGIGLLGKLIADSFEEVPSGPERALTAVGATRSQRYFSATWPQGVPSLIGNSLYLVDTNIRAATILGIVGGSGIGFYLTNASSVLTLHGQVTTLVVMVIVTVLVVEGIATWMRRVFR